MLGREGMGEDLRGGCLWVRIREVLGGVPLPILLSLNVHPPDLGRVDRCAEEGRNG